MTTRIQRSALLPYPAQALFDLVNDVASYPEFLPWCRASQVLEVSELHMLASLEVAKGSLSQRFVTRNTLQPGQRIEMNLQEGPFTRLHGVWEFKALGDKACKISLDLSFDSLILSEGRKVDIRSRVVSVQEDKVDKSKVGLGAVLGGVLGGVVDGGSGALIGALVGGGGAVVGTKGDDVELPAGTVLTLQLERTVSVARR